MAKRWWIPMIALAASALSLGPAGAHEVNDQAHADSETRRVVFVAGPRSHGYGAHSHNAGCLLLARLLEKHHPAIETQVYQNGWPEEKDAFQNADAIVMFNDGGKWHIVNDHLKQVDKLADQGVGIVALHYGVEVPKGKPGDHFLKWIGGHFETHYSVNPFWTAHYKSLPDHPIARGVKPFSIRDEWYYHMRLRPKLQDVTPILTAMPPIKTLRGWQPGDESKAHHGNPHVYEAVVKREEPQHTAWAATRDNGQRGFGFTGAHFHWNWAHDEFRKVVLNAIAWTAHAQVPSDGITTPTPTAEALMQNLDYEKPESFSVEKLRQKIKRFNAR
jgi:type 1 glutamine amidotransferase